MDGIRSHQYDAEGLNVGSWPEPTAGNLITPANRFFRRSHAAVPMLDATRWRLLVQGLAHRSAAYTLDQLASAFPRREVDATIICAGLRRSEFLSLGPLPGELPWGPDALSTGRWSGIALADVLRAADIDAEARHVEFLGLDCVERHGQRFSFGGSITLAKAMSDEVLLATHLNGEPLPPAHGFPMRVVVPGWIGARNVKWLGRINVSAHPSENYFQTKAYRVQRDVNPDDPRDVSAGIAMSASPLNAVILDPHPRAVVAAGDVRLRGWAIGGEGRPLTSIEVSANNGADWVRADPVASAKWTWTFWEAVVRLAPGSHVLCARASDGASAMPCTVNHAWNVKGYGNNAWYRVPIMVQ